MTMRVQTQIDRLLAQRAAEWMETLKSADAGERAAFVQWLRQSKLHVEHYLDLEYLDVQIRSLPNTRGPDIDALLAQVAPNVRSLEKPAGVRARRWKEGFGVIGVRPRWLIAASVTAIAVMATLATSTLPRIRTFVASENVATGIGEQRTLTLPDGSLISMNVDTRVSIDYDADSRNVELSSGEALFTVAHDTKRPFVVHTPAANVRALGTQFNVYQRRQQATLVSVIEGRVQVTTPPPAPGRSNKTPASQRLEAGEEAQVSGLKIEKRTHPDVSKTVAWRERRLFFDDTALDEMVKEFNRYGGPLILQIEGIEPGTHRFGGTFNAGDPASFVDILEQQKDLAVERRAGKIVIRKR